MICDVEADYEKCKFRGCKTQCTPVIYFLKYKTVLVEMPSITFDI